MLQKNKDGKLISHMSKTSQRKNNKYKLQKCRIQDIIKIREDKLVKWKIKVAESTKTKIGL